MYWWHNWLSIDQGRWMCHCGCGCTGNIWQSGSCFNIKMLSSHGDLHCTDKPVIRPSYLCNVNSHTCKTASLHWDNPNMGKFWWCWWWSWSFKNAYKLLYLRVPEISILYEIIPVNNGKIFACEFQRYVWNSTQHILSIHWKICILYRSKILRALRFKSL